MSKINDRAAKRAAEFASRPVSPPSTELTSTETKQDHDEAGEGARAIAGMILPTGTPKQTKGASEAAARTASAAPIKETIGIDLADLHVRPGYERDAGEFDGKEFQELVDSIRAHGGNHQPIDVRQVRGPQHPTLYQIVAGERRFRALMRLNEESRQAHKQDPENHNELFKTALCSVREIDDATADRIHDEENAKRAAKRPYSLAKQLSTMMASGRYSTASELADRIGRSRGDVSVYLSIYDKAPHALWTKVTDPTSLTQAECRTILKGFDKPAFSDWVKRLDPAAGVPLSTVVKKAKDVCARPKPTKSEADQVREKERGDAFHIVIPKSLPHEIRAKVLAYAKRLASGEVDPLG